MFHQLALLADWHASCHAKVGIVASPGGGGIGSVAWNLET
jgi:hypothetical protein